MKSYTVDELDALRQAVEHKWLFGTYGQPDAPCGMSISRTYMGAEKEQSVEAIVRTHMLAGHTADDLIKAEREAWARLTGSAA